MPFLYEKYRHSAGSANAMIEDPASVIWRWGLRNWGEDTPRMAMGTAAEQAAYAGLLHRLSPLQIAREALRCFDAIMLGEVCPERNYAVRCALRLYRALEPLGPPLAYNPWRPVRVADLAHEVTVKPDFVYPEMLVDAKCTLRMPFQPSAGHVRQQALYSAAHEKPAWLLYVTPAKHPPVKPPKRGAFKLSRFARTPVARWFLVGRDEVVAGCYEMHRAWWQIEKWNTSFQSAQHAARFIPLNLNSYRWSNPTDAANAVAFWESAIHHPAS